MQRPRLNDSQIASVVGCSVWTVRKWRRRSKPQGRIGLTSHMGRPARGPGSTFPSEVKERLLYLRKLHPGWGPATLVQVQETSCVRDSNVSHPKGCTRRWEKRSHEERAEDAVALPHLLLSFP